MYTLDDYKKLKGDIKLGGLGPDLENVNKREKVKHIINKKSTVNNQIFFNKYN